MVDTKVYKKYIYIVDINIDI